MVSGEIDHIDIYIGHKIGKHYYSFIKEKGSSGMGALPYELKIDDYIYCYWISSEELRITLTNPGGGGVHYFVKTN